MALMPHSVASQLWPSNVTVFKHDIGQNVQAHSENENWHEAEWPKEGVVAQKDYPARNGNETDSASK